MEEEKIESMTGSILKGVIAAAKGIFPALNAVASVVEVGKALYDLSDKFDEAVDLTSELNAQLAIENSTINTLFGRLNSATKGTQEYDSAKSAIIDRYGRYLQGMGSEIESLDNVRGAYDAVKNAARESITERLRATKIEQQTSAAMKSFESADDKIYDSLNGRLKNAKIDDIMPQIREALEAENTTILSNAEAAYNRVRMVLNKNFGKQGGISVLTSISGGLKQWLDASEQLDSSLAEINAKFASTTMVSTPQKPRKEVASKTPSTDTAADGAEKKRTTANEVEKKRATAIEAQKTLRETLIEIAFETEQALINAKEAGFEKDMAQIELNYRKKQMAIELWEREQRKIVVEAQKAAFIANGGTELNFKVDSDDARFIPINKAYDAKSDANNTERIDAEKSILDNLRQQWQQWGDEYQQTEYKLTETAQRAAKDRANIAAAVASGKLTKEQGEAETGTVNRGEQQATVDLNATKVKLSSDLSSILRDLQGMSQREVQELIGVINDKLKNSKLSSVDATALTEQLDKAKDYSASLNPFKGLIDGISDVKNATKELEAAKNKLGEAKKNPEAADEVKKAEDEVIAAQKNVNDTKKRKNDSASESINKISGVASATSDLLKTFGVESPAVDGVVNSLSALGEINFANPVSIITGGLKAVSSLLGGIFGEMDAVKERKIQEIQKQVDALEKSYEKLGEKVDKAYSTDASELIRQQDEMLSQQKLLINQQIREEESKKKSDSGKVNSYKQALEDIDKQLEDNIVKAQDAIFGADVEGAIDEFANAYADAWAAGEDRAKAMKDVVKNMIKGVVIEMLKSDLAPTIKKIRAEIESMLVDGVIDDYEQARLDSIIDEATSSANKKYDWADKYLKDEDKDGSKETDREVAKRGIATASQESVDENNGRLTAIQGHTFELNEQLKLMQPDVSSIKESVSFMRDNAAAQLDALYGIRDNTAPIAAMKTEISAMKNDINTLVIKGITIRP